jgi:hypothetical protein
MYSAVLRTTSVVVETRIDYKRVRLIQAFIGLFTFYPKRYPGRVKNSPPRSVKNTIVRR